MAEPSRLTRIRILSGVLGVLFTGLVVGSVVVGRAFDRFLRQESLGSASSSGATSPVPSPGPPTASPSTPPSPEHPELVITKLKVDAPIVWDVSPSDESVYLAALQHGVAQIAGTAKPGEKGNLVLFGHSSYLRADPGQYKQIFRDLNQLQRGDQITIVESGQSFQYVVQRSFLVAPDDLSILAPSSNEEVTIFTCWPPKTIEKRWVIQAVRTG